MSRRLPSFRYTVKSVGWFPVLCLRTDRNWAELRQMEYRNCATTIWPGRPHPGAEGVIGSGALERIYV